MNGNASLQRRFRLYPCTIRYKEAYGRTSRYILASRQRQCFLFFDESKYMACNLLDNSISLTQGGSVIEHLVLPVCGNLVCRAEVLPLLYAMGDLITEGGDLQRITTVLLRIMEDHLGVSCAMLTLHHRRTGTIFIHESLGLTAEQEARGVYNLGEGITGKVVESGKAITFYLPDEPWNHLEISGAAWGSMSLLGANDANVSNSMVIRVMVSASSIWGFVSIAIIVVVIAGLAFLFMKLGRR